VAARLRLPRGSLEPGSGQTARNLRQFLREVFHTVGSRDIPGAGDSFAVQRLPNDTLLSKVARILDEVSVSIAVRQAAVWIVTDDANFQDLGILTTGGISGLSSARTIDEMDAWCAIAICSAAGVDVYSKRIMRDDRALAEEFNKDDVRWVRLRDMQGFVGDRAARIERIGMRYLGMAALFDEEIKRYKPWVKALKARHQPEDFSVLAEDPLTVGILALPEIENAYAQLMTRILEECGHEVIVRSKIFYVPRLLGADSRGADARLMSRKTPGNSLPEKIYIYVNQYPEKPIEQAHALEELLESLFKMDVRVIKAGVREGRDGPFGVSFDPEPGSPDLIIVAGAKSLLPVRTWTDKQGRQVEAALLSASRDSKREFVGRFQTLEGQVFHKPIAEMSTYDIRLVDSVMFSRGQITARHDLTDTE
jgi:hypothetical protein